MKAVILAGGKGTRISEESQIKPKPMVEIGGRPIIWHLMRYYSHFGINDFVICSGYKSYIIKEYFANYALHNADITVDLSDGSTTFIRNQALPWKVHVIDTGEDAMTGGRLRQIKAFVQDDEAFCMTYGDGLSNVDITASIDFHRDHGKLATMTIVAPLARFGNVKVADDIVTSFKEKPQTEAGLINGGFFVLSPRTLDLVDGDQTVWEQEPLHRLVEAGELAAWHHTGFWQPMDTLREKLMLESLWRSGAAPWKLWG